MLHPGRGPPHERHQPKGPAARCGPRRGGSGRTVSVLPNSSLFLRPPRALGFTCSLSLCPRGWCLSSGLGYWDHCSRLPPGHAPSVYSVTRWAGPQPLRTCSLSHPRPPSLPKAGLVLSHPPFRGPPQSSVYLRSPPFTCSLLGLRSAPVNSRSPRWTCGRGVSCALPHLRPGCGAEPTGRRSPLEGVRLGAGDVWLTSAPSPTSHLVLGLGRVC